MTTTYENFSTVPTLRETVQMRMARMLMENASKSNRTRAISSVTGTVVSQVAKAFLHLFGFISLTIAGFTINMTAGFIVAGLSLFVFSALILPDRTDQDASNRG